MRGLLEKHDLGCWLGRTSSVTTTQMRGTDCLNNWKIFRAWFNLNRVGSILLRGVFRCKPIRVTVGPFSNVRPKLLDLNCDRLRPVVTLTAHIRSGILFCVPFSTPTIVELDGKWECAKSRKLCVTEWSGPRLVVRKPN